MAKLNLKHIYKVYPNGTKAVSDFNMEISDKEFINICFELNSPEKAVYTLKCAIAFTNSNLPS